MAFKITRTFPPIMCIILAVKIASVIASAEASSIDSRDVMSPSYFNPASNDGMVMKGDETIILSPPSTKILIDGNKKKQASLTPKMAANENSGSNLDSDVPDEEHDRIIEPIDLLSNLYASVEGDPNVNNARNEREETEQAGRIASQPPRFVSRNPTTVTSTSTKPTTTSSTLPPTTAFNKRIGGSKAIDISWLFPDYEDLENGILGVKNNTDFPLMMKRMELYAKNSFEEVFRRALPHMIRNFYGLDLSSECLSSLLQFLDGLKTLKGWALKMVDSAGFYPGGFFEGSLVSFGSYDMCVNTKATRTSRGGKGSKNEEIFLFTGQYCSIDIRISLPPKPRPLRPELLFADKQEELNLIKELDLLHLLGYMYLLAYRTAICIPSTCMKEDIQSVLNMVSNYLGIVNITANQCEVKEGAKFDGPMIFCMVLVSTAVFFVLIATLVDLLHQNRKTEQKSSKTAVFEKAQTGLFLEVCQAFSFIRNGKKIFEISKSSEENAKMNFLHGIRFFSIAWVVLGHVYYYINLQQIGGLSKVQTLGSDPWFQLVLNGTFSVDAFFLMSGFLVAYICLQKTDEYNGRFSYIVFYLHRIWRLTPAYMFIIAITIILPSLGSGPIWKETMDSFVGTCRQRWWTNMLYINNFVRQKDMCISPSWYLATNFQYFLISPPLVTALYRKPRLGLMILLFLTLLSMALSGALTFLWQLPPTGIFTQPDIDERNDYLVYMYQMPYNHGGPFFIGMALGYFLYKNKDFKIKPATKWIGWIMSTVVCLSVIFSIYPWNRGDNLPVALGALYSCFSRTAWGLALAWIFFACFTGNGGVVNSILSMKPIIPLARLTYCVYLVHILFLFVYQAYARHVYYFSHLVAIYFFCAIMFLSYVSALICTVTFESPFISLEKIVFTKLGKLAMKKSSKPIKVEGKENPQQVTIDEVVVERQWQHLPKNVEIATEMRAKRTDDLLDVNVKNQDVLTNYPYLEQLVNQVSTISEEPKLLSPNTDSAKDSSPVYTCRL